MREARARIVTMTTQTRSRNRIFHFVEDALRVQLHVDDVIGIFIDDVMILLY